MMTWLVSLEERKEKEESPQPSLVFLPSECTHADLLTTPTLLLPMYLFSL